MGTDVDKLREFESIDVLDGASNTLRVASEFVQSRKFPMPKHWSPEELDELEFPTDLTNISFDELGRQMGLWTSVVAYTQYQVALCDIENTAKYNKLEFERRKLYLKLLEEKTTEEQRKSILRSDLEIKKLQAESDIAKAKFVLLKALLDSYNKYSATFSRELSRRDVVGGSGRPPQEYEENMDLSDGKEKAKSLFLVAQERRAREGVTDGDS